MTALSYKALWFRVTRQQSCHASSAHELVTVFNANAKQLEELGRRVGYTKASIHFDALTRTLHQALSHLPEVERYRILLIRWMRLMLEMRRDDVPKFQDARMVVASIARAMGVAIVGSICRDHVDQLIDKVDAWKHQQ